MRQGSDERMVGLRECFGAGWEWIANFLGLWVISVFVDCDEE